MPGDVTEVTPLTMHIVTLRDGSEAAIACVAGCCSDEQLVDQLQAELPDDGRLDLFAAQRPELPWTWYEVRARR
ncbi:hypothetical protein [Streptomyces sp. KR80]|uniref:hypothetical protein n=1 Tax=Streptomyces sp. KR80 TaxID=3457426 RepID=UPI003FCF4D64